MQQRLETSTAGRVAISAFVIVLMIAILTANLPASALQRQLLRIDHGIVYGLGLDQNWNVFAPDPRQQSLDLEARLRFADASAGVWRPPSGGALIGSYWDYRWRKWLEYATQESNAFLWAPAAAYAGRQEVDRTPTQVALVRRSADLPPPGHVRDPVKWKDEQLYVMPVTPANLSEWGG